MKKIIALLVLLFAVATIQAQSLLIYVSGGINEFTTSEKDDLIQAYNYTPEDIPRSPTMFGGDIIFRPIPYLSMGAGYRAFLGKGPRNEITAKFGPTIPVGIFEGSIYLVGGFANGLYDPDFRFAYGTDVDLSLRLGHVGFHLRPGVRIFSEDLPYEVYDSQNVSQGVEFLKSTVVNVLVEGGVSVKLNLGDSAED